MATRLKILGYSGSKTPIVMGNEEGLDLPPPQYHNEWVGYLIHPINPNIIDLFSLQHCPGGHTSSIYSHSQIPTVTWSFNRDTLNVLTDGIWEGIVQSSWQGKVLDKLIPKFAATDMLPYRQLDGMVQHSIILYSTVLSTCCRSMFICSYKCHPNRLHSTWK